MLSICRRALALASLVAVLPVVPAAGQTAEPGFIPLIGNPTTVLSVPRLPMPAYLVPYVDPVFGVPCTRITEISGRTLPYPGGGSGSWGADARHNYSKNQPWNSTETLYMIENNGGTPGNVLLDGQTFAPKLQICDSYPQYDDRWHPSPAHPNERINVTGNGRELMWFDVVNCVKTRTWSLPFAVSDLGMGEGNVSREGRYVALSDGNRMFVVDMDPQPPLSPYPNKRIGPAVTIADCGLSGGCAVDWVSVSASGKYAVVSYDGDYPRVYDVDPVTLALTPHALPGTIALCSGGSPAQGHFYNLGHADMTLNPFDNDEDVIIGQEGCGNIGSTVKGKLMGGIVMVRLRDGTITPLTDPTNEAYPHHISTRNLFRPGWVYAGYYREAGARFNDEIIAVKLDGSKTTQRFAHKHSEWISPDCYRCQNHAVPSPDGRRIAWASNWADDCTTCGSLGEIKDYVLDARTAAPDTLGPAARSDLRLR